MKLNQKIVKISAVTLACAVGITSVVITAKNSNKTEEVVASTEQTEGVTAGFSNVWNTENVYVSSLTAGVAEAVNDVNTLKISDTDVRAVASTAEEGFCGYINLGIVVVDGNLNVRSGASTDNSIVGKMTNHAACEILETNGEWTHIQSGNVDGWVKSEYLLTGEEALAIAKEEVRTVATATTGGLRVRMEPNTDCTILDLVAEGEDLTVIENLGEWVKVEFDDEENPEGYVFAEYVEISQKLKTGMTLKELRYGNGVSQTRVDLVDFALQYVGGRYVWGGTSLTKGVDCSGFTMKVYEHFGISLPHSSAAQAGYGTKIKASEAQPGDLFFYSRGGSGIGHVAIYIGNGQIVHAASSRDGIKISSAYYRTPLAVRRIID